MLVNKHFYYLFFQVNQKENLTADIEKEWDTEWEIFPELSNNSMEPVTIPLSSHFATYTTTPPPLNTALPLLPAPPPSTFIPSSLAITTPIHPLPPTAPSNRVKPPSQPPGQPFRLPPPFPLSHLHLHFRHLPQTTTIQKEKQSQKIYLHHHTEEMLTDIGYFPFHRH